MMELEIVSLLEVLVICFQLLVACKHSFSFQSPLSRYSCNEASGCVLVEGNPFECGIASTTSSQSTSSGTSGNVETSPDTTSSTSATAIGTGDDGTTTIRNDDLVGTNQEGEGSSLLIPILLAVIAVLVAIGVLIGSIFLYRFRRKRQTETPNSNLDPSAST